MMKPFNWEYPALVYSKDEELLEAPFPLICGISREVYLKSIQGNEEIMDRYIFDLDKFEFVIKCKGDWLGGLAPFCYKEKRNKIQQMHIEHFNSASSHMIGLDSSERVVDMRDRQLAEELSEETDPEEKEVVDYVRMYQMMWEEVLVVPLEELGEVDCCY